MALAPRGDPTAMLYADIDGFTQLSERVLKTPSAVAQLVALWSREVVHLVWEHGGAFDKMVGDCVIALFRSPVLRGAGGAPARPALRCAKAIRDMTRSLPHRAGWLTCRRASGRHSNT
ncbi:MAG: adenylate/guanylate cyclase domain-containing protein [Gemmobacter sp.]|nr:adenylate/guanylate cyclase domain-containing protein [Gemmobacter sp.]